MNLDKIGKFISECRKNKKLTQEQLAEQLNISDRAVSKWERGLCLPDASIMIPLCEILGINVNELLSGEMIEMNNYNKKLEQNLIDMVKQKEESDKRLLTMEIVIGIIVVITLLVLMGIASYVEMEEHIRLLIIIPSIIAFIAIAFVMIRIEQVAGYYECEKCHHKYVPKYSSVLWAMHMGRTRYLKCPKCHEKSWNKKVLTK